MMNFKQALAKIDIHLSQELGRGGEGAVFAIEGQRDRVAKIYSSPPDKLKIQKLSRMVKIVNPAILQIAAWPIDLITDIKGTVRGFVMPRVIDQRDIHELYSPKSRAEAFPEADFRFLVHVSTNIARAFAIVHEHNHVLGDINHGNLLVGSDGTVMLIDCDSFQIGTGANVFTCDVGIPLFTPPELHIQKTFRTLIRTPDHDRFGLAVLLFHLLYMGRHPFAGRYSGPGDMPIEKAITEYRFPYGPDRKIHNMEPPPGTISLEAMGRVIAGNFIRAFGRSRKNSGRPDAKSWIIALENLKNDLRFCSVVNWHQYPGELNSCPWCAIEAQTTVRLFGQRIIVTEPTRRIDLETLWQTIVTVKGPSADPPLPSEGSWKPPVGTNLLKRLRKFISICIAFSGMVACNVWMKEGEFIVVMVTYALAFIVWPKVSPEKRSAIEKAFSKANAEWNMALERWKYQASQKIFTEKLQSLRMARTELADLPNEKHRRLVKLKMQLRNHQLQRYLDRFRINLAKIEGIGPSRKSMLTSYGIETALDVTYSKIIKIPGFGKHLTSKLIKWRESHEQNFRFNPNEPVDPLDIDKLNQELTSRRENLLKTLREGPNSLRRLSQEISTARSRLMPMLERKWNDYKTAKIRRDTL